MQTIYRLAAATALATVLAGPAFSQAALIGTEALDDRIDDIRDDVEEDLARGEDDERFAGNQVPQGWRGSAALTASAASGNTDTGKLQAAGRLTYGINDWSHTVGLAVEYNEANGVKNEERWMA